MEFEFVLSGKNKENYFELMKLESFPSMDAGHDSYYLKTGEVFANVVDSTRDAMRKSFPEMRPYDNERVGGIVELSETYYSSTLYGKTEFTVAMLWNPKTMEMLSLKAQDIVKDMDGIERSGLVLKGDLKEKNIKKLYSMLGKNAFFRNVVITPVKENYNESVKILEGYKDFAGEKIVNLSVDKNDRVMEHVMRK